MLKRRLALSLVTLLAFPASAQTTPPPAPTPNQQIITDLQQLLAQAQSGEMIGFSYTAVYSGSNFAYNWEGDDTGGQIGKAIITLFAHYNGFLGAAEISAAHISGFTAGTTAAGALIDASGIGMLSTQVRAISPQ